MDFRELFLSQHARAHAFEVGRPDFSTQEQILRDLSEEQLSLRPHPAFNSIAWLLWHMTRDEDIAINLILTERLQVLDQGEWLKRLGVSNRDSGTGMTMPEVDEFSQSVDIPVLLAYRTSVGMQTRAVVGELEPERLDELIGEDVIQKLVDAGVFSPNASWVPARWQGKPKSHALMHITLAHTFLHLGQCEDIRGLLEFHSH